MDGFARWGFDRRGWSSNTRAQYLRRAQQADRWLREHRGVTLRRARLDDVYAWLSTLPPTPASRNHARKAILAYMEYAGRRPLDIPPLRLPRKLPRVLDHIDAARLWKAAQGHSRLMEAFVALLLYSALRFTEARALRWVSVNGGWLDVVGKGSKDRAVPMHPFTAEALTRWRAANSDPLWVFPSPRHRGEPISEQAVRDRFAEVVDAAGVVCTPHMLRATAATDMLDRGAHVRDVQEILGHANLSTSAAYLASRDGRLEDAIKRLGY